MAYVALAVAGASRRQGAVAAAFEAQVKQARKLAAKNATTLSALFPFPRSSFPSNLPTRCPKMFFQIDARFDDLDTFALEELFLQGGVGLAN
jgi:hypothetical protein